MKLVSAFRSGIEGALNDIWENNGEDITFEHDSSLTTTTSSTATRRATFNQIEQLVSQKEVDFLNEYQDEIKRTIIVKNLPTKLTAQHITKSSPVSGGYHSVTFWAEGGSSNQKTALVEFQTQEGVPKNWGRKLYNLNQNTRFEASTTLCTRLALQLEVEYLLDSRVQFEQRVSTAKVDYEAQVRKLKKELDEEVSFRKTMQLEMSTNEREIQSLREQIVELKTSKKKKSSSSSSSSTTSPSTNNSSTTSTQSKHAKKKQTKTQVEQQLNKQKQLLYRQEERKLLMMHNAFNTWRENVRRIVEDRQNEELTLKFLEEERKSIQQELEKKHYPCNICLDDKTIEDMYTLDNCDHRFCWNCITEYLDLKIKEGQGLTAEKIGCPDPKCNKPMRESEVKTIVGEDRYHKYEKFILDSVLNTMGDVRWCPKSGCGNAMIGDDNTLMIVCSNQNCRFTFCYQCKEEWHADSTCADYQKWKIENNEGEAKYAEWVRSNARECPKCKAYIEKNGGCNHMTCKNCKHEFCWLCMGVYSSTHFGKMPWSCKQFS